MRSAMIKTTFAGLTALWLGLAAASDTRAEESAVDLAVPRVRMRLEGPMGARLDGVIHNWLIPAPDANPGMEIQRPDRP